MISRREPTGIDINVLHRNRVVLNPIELHCTDIVVVNRESEERATGDRYETQTIAFASFDFDHGVGY